MCDELVCLEFGLWVGIDFCVFFYFMTFEAYFCIGMYIVDWCTCECMERQTLQKYYLKILWIFRGVSEVVVFCAA